jgi:hypothetical protein
MVYPGMKTALLALLWAGSAAALAAEPESFWFRNETKCGEVRVTVRSYCEVAHRENAVMQRNTGCGEQQLVIEQPGKKVVKRDLLEHEPVEDDYHVADSLRCVSAGKQRYLVINMSTGGSCDTCELQAVLGLDGRWKRYGDKWTAGAAEQRALRESEATWRKEPVFDLPNNVRESKQ